VLPLGLGVVGGVAGLRWFGAGLSRRRVAETGLITLGLLAVGISAAGLVGRAAAASSGCSPRSSAQWIGLRERDGRDRHDRRRSPAEDVEAPAVRAFAHDLAVVGDEAS
jgi:hypothetical protein